MRHISGTAEFGGRLGYCQQTAWIQNATLRDNVVFGQKWDESRYWQCVRDACLLPDLEILPDGDLTEVSGHFLPARDIADSRLARKVSTSRAVKSNESILPEHSTSMPTSSSSTIR